MLLVCGDGFLLLRDDRCLLCDGFLLLRDDGLLRPVRLLQLTDVLLAGCQLVGKR